MELDHAEPQPTPSDTATENEAPANTETENQGDEGTSQENKVQFDDDQQIVVDKIRNKEVFKKNEALRDNERLQKELDDIKASKPIPTEPEVPEAPNPEDFIGDTEGFNAKIAERDAAIEKRTEFRSGQQNLEDQAVNAQNDEKRKVAEARTARETAYAEGGKTLGLTQEKMLEDAVTVGKMGISHDVQDFLMSDKKTGPLFTNYLASNIHEVEKLKTMTSMQAAVYLNNEIKPKLSSARETTGAPNPTNVVTGRGAPNKVSPLIKGATFE